ncbi:uncharacterized protein HRG_11439 [Hirsutella rhossiliensis]|uniref:DUF7892 domain-containing protein n=1 Tax=Hirsutella rhossiliensis TaxID=111463 RepID=A0A9P8MLQ3_9HYPO|nr:uncharacterized protein HRG_11439 [Hirsutella rhossiliensis]KAH0957292.1 hypothetical protein HRG_11439 [Hirsutella rhossiliensis]
MESAADSEDTSHSRSVKRKTSDLASPSGPAGAKRMRLGENGFGSHPDRTFRLPAEIWHRIFALLPPKTLGCLLAVNKRFHKYLDPSSPVEDDISQPCHVPPSILPPLKPDAIWQASRRFFWPHMPGPLKGRSEIEMWRLCCTRSCQFCGTRVRPESGRTQDQWHRGPGAKGVSPIFPFFLVICGRCLSENTIKEVHLFLSPSIPSFLLAGLPMVFVTSELHVIPPQLLSTGTDLMHSQVAKIFSSEQAKAIHAEFEGVKALGHAAAEEWVKGLEARGKRSLADASRWERWYLAGGVHDMRASLQSLQSSTQKTEAPSPTRILDAQASVNEPQKSGGDVMQHREPPTSIHDLIRTQPEVGNVATGPGSRPVDHAKLAEEEAAELKALRKAEIERRAALLDPPFTLSDLSRVPAFLAMIRIPVPLDERAWGTLKQRLLDHREAAEQRRPEIPAPISSHPESMNATEQWDETQGPLRARISGFADDYIRHSWNDGANLSKKEASRFAVEVLFYVRKRFYAEVAKDAAAVQAAGRRAVPDPPTGPWTQKLTLEHMKWIFDAKIKKHTDRHGTELFFCTGCSGNRKAFGLQAVVQHYAAKHTAALSMGNRVVHWRTEWPETPIFESDPRRKTTKQAGEGSKSDPLQPPLPHGRDSHPALPPSGASNQALGHAARAPNASQAPPVPAHANLRQPLQHPQVPTHPSYPQRLQLVGPQPPEQAPGASSTGKGNASRTNNPAATADCLNRGQYVARLNYMARICKEIWRKIAHMHDLPDSTKAHVLLHHIVARFEEKFSERPSLNTFIDGMSNHRDMRPARSIKSLHCKTCDFSHDAEAEPKPLTFPQLLKHFKMKHSEGTGDQLGSGPVDWHFNMIRSPDRRAIPELQKSLGKHEAALQIVTDALPWAGQVKTPKAPAVDQRQGPMSGAMQQKRPVQNAGNTSHDLSRATSFQHQLDRKTNPLLTIMGQGQICGLREWFTGQRRALTDICQNGMLPREHPLAASVPYARLHEDGFEILGSLESHLESERGVVTPRDALRQDARYGGRPRAASDRIDHASNLEYLAGRYDEPYHYALPVYDGGVQGYYQGPGPWAPQASSAIRQGTGYRPYGVYPQGFTAQSVQVAEPYYPREPRAPELYPRHGSVVYGDEMGPPAAYASRPPLRMDYEEYDPRYPETGRGTAAAASREARR